MSATQSDAPGFGDNLILTCLAPLPIWVAWRLDLADGDYRKVPYNPNTGGRASSTDPNTWGTRAQAGAAAKILLKGSGFGDKPTGGVGIILTDIGDGMSIGGVDLDTCRNKETGVFTEWAQEVMHEIPSYAEISPSETGAKIFVKYRTADIGALKEAAGIQGDVYSKAWKTKSDVGHAPGIELYLGRRWFAVTGDQCSDSDELIEVTPKMVARVVEVGEELKGEDFSQDGAYKPGDNSRSAVSYRFVLNLWRHNPDLTLEQMIEQLEASEDAQIEAWLADSNDARNLQRALKRLYSRTKEPGARLREKDRAKSAADALVEEFNKNYMVVNAAGKAIVFEHKYDTALKRWHYMPSTFEDFKRFYMNKIVQDGNNADGRPRYRTAGDAWLHHRDRQQYLGGVVFNPPPEEAPPDTLNLWDGYGYRGHHTICTKLHAKPGR